MDFRTRIIGLVALGIAAGFSLACGSTSSVVESAGLKEGAAMSFAMNSPEWKMGDEIPSKFTCDGENVSPSLHWSAAPAETQSLALIVEDPDAPGGTFTHWTIYDLPPSTRELPENVPQQGDLPNGAHQGQNGFGQVGYGGPCPPPGPAHRYYFRIYALNRKTGLAAGAGRAGLDRAIRGHVLVQAEFMGRYRRR